MRVLSILVVLALSSSAAAEPPAKKKKLDDHAEAVIAAFDDGDPEALAAMSDDRDLLITALELCTRGRVDAARALCEAAPNGAGKRPLALLEPEIALTPEAAGWVLYRRVRDNKTAKAAENIELLARIPDTAGAVTRARLAYLEGLSLSKLKRRKESADAFERAAAMMVELDWRSPARESMDYAIRARRSARETEAAMAYARKALETLTAWDDQRGRLVMLEHQLLYLIRRGDEVALRKHLDDVIRTAEAIGHSASASSAMIEVGTSYRRQGRYDEALAWLARGLAVAEQSGDDDRVRVGLLRRAALYRKRADYRNARADLERAEVLARRGGDPLDLGDVLQQLGNLHVRSGALADALRAFEAAYALGVKVKRPRFRATLEARALTGLGLVHNGLGDYEAAAKAYRGALAMHEKLGDRRSMAIDLHNLGTVESDPRAAIELFQRALTLRRERGDRFGVASTLAAMGGSYALFDKGRAREAFAEAAAVFRELRATRREAMIENSLGALVVEDDPKQSIAHFERALEIFGDAISPHFEMLLCANLANANLQIEDRAASVRWARRATRASGFTFGGLGTEQAARAKENWIRIFRSGSLAALESDALEDLAFFAETSRAGSLLEAIEARGTLRDDLIPPALTKAVEEAQAKERRAIATLRGATEQRNFKAVRSARKALKDAQAALQQTVERVQREAKAGAALAYPEPAPLQAVQAALRPGEALVFYGLTIWGSWALIVEPDGARAVALPKEETIFEAVDALLLDDPPYLEPKAAKALLAMLVDPLRLDDEVTSVLISPTARLGYVPFALLLPERDVSYVSSGTVLTKLREAKTERGSGVLGLGDPDYGTQASGPAHRGAGMGKRLMPLPATRAEVEAIANHKLLGAEATEGKLRTMLAARPRWRSVHFACHGLVDAERPMFSSLALTPEESGDGYLTALEIFRMRVPADGVILSACETAKGKVYRSEGIVGLTQAFLFAGAPRVLCSLWKVDDEATNALMQAFYRMWNPKSRDPESAATALRRAMAEVRSQPRWAHPQYWAAWVLWGLPE